MLFRSAAADEDAPPPGKKKTEDSPKDSNKEREPADFTIELEAANGALARLPLSRFGSLPPPLKVQFTKWPAMDRRVYEKPAEPVFQTFELPLSAFAAAAPGFDPATLRAIRLRFDRTPTSVIVLSEVGFGEAKE